MFKKLLCLALSFLIATSANAQVAIGNATIGNMTVKSGIHNDTALVREMLKYPGLTFVKDYSTGTINADFSVGSPTGTFTSTRSATAPATYIDANGVIQVSTTSDVPLFDLGEYSTTGFTAVNKGYHAYRASTNLLTRTDGTAYSSGLWTGWSNQYDVASAPTPTNQSIPELTSIASSVSQRIQYVSGGDTNKIVRVESPYTTAGTVVQNDVVTVSFFARSITGNTGVTLKAQIVSRNAATSLLTVYQGDDIAGLLSTAWRKFTFSATITDATSSRVSFKFGAHGDVGTGDAVDFEIALPQLEKLPYATPFIPTTTAALTRAGDVLKYANAGNSTADEETIIIQLATTYTTSVNGINNFAYSTDTKRRQLRHYTNQDDIRFNPNTDDSTVSVASAESHLLNTSYVYVGVAKHSSPRALIYRDGVLVGSSTTDYINPSWGTYNYIGSDNNEKLQLDGNIRRVIKFNRALSSTEISAIYTYLIGLDLAMDKTPMNVRIAYSEKAVSDAIEEVFNRPLRLGVTENELLLAAN